MSPVTAVIRGFGHTYVVVPLGALVLLVALLVPVQARDGPLAHVSFGSGVWAAIDAMFLGPAPPAAIAVVPSARWLPPEKFGWSIATALALMVQSLLVAWLVVGHRQRRGADVAPGRRFSDPRTDLAMITHLHRRALAGEVTAAIAHELNQPLEAILHNAEAGELMLESGTASSAELRCILADIRRIDMRASEIISRVRRLLCAKEIEKRSIDINAIAREAADVMTPVARASGVCIELELATDIGDIAGDAIQLQQVLLNLLLNGIQAMGATPRAQRRVGVTTALAGRQIEVAVRDSGPGFPADAPSRIFEPFFTTKSTGMGMGLAIARLIVEAHDGRIAAHNNVGGGATVRFALPVAAAASGVSSQ